MQRRFLLSLAAGLPLFACQWIPPLGLKAPKIDIKSVDLADISRSTMRFALVLDATNSNDQDITLSNLVFDFLLQGKPSGNGSANQTQLLLPKNATSAVPVSFSLELRPVLDILKTVPSKELGKVAYAIQGSALWGTGPIKLPFEKRNTLDSIPKLAQWLRLL